MPLNPSTLQSGFEAIFGPNDRPKTTAESARRLAAAYASYAQGAISCAGGSPIDVSAGRSAMEAILASALAAPPSPASAATTAAAFGAGVVALWAVTVFSGPVPGVTVPVAAGPALQAALLALWPTMTLSRASYQLAAAQHAAAFDVASRLVIVIHPLVPTPCTAPIA